MHRRSLMFGVGALALSGCASVPPPPARPIAPAPPTPEPPAAAGRVIVAPGPGPAELESVYAVTASRTGLTVKVASNGCTTKADFAFFVEKKAEVTTVAFARKRLDRGRTIQAGHADLEFTFAELGIEPNTPVFVLNPFGGL